jgi:hypothetical protein
MDYSIIFRLNGEKQTSQYLKDATHHVSNLFNPVHLFHLFLAEASVEFDSPPGKKRRREILRDISAKCDLYFDMYASCSLTVAL